MNSLTLPSVQFGRRDHDGQPGRLRKGAMAAAALGALTLPIAASTPAFADPGPSGSGSGQVVLNHDGSDGFSVRLHGDPLPGADHESCSVTRSGAFNDTTLQCAKDDPTADSVRGGAEALGLAALMYLIGRTRPVQALGKRMRGLRKNHNA